MVHAANGAGFASLMSNLEIGMGCAQLTLGANVGVHAGAFAADGCPKNLCGCNYVKFAPLRAITRLPFSKDESGRQIELHRHTYCRFPRGYTGREALLLSGCDAGLIFAPEHPQ